MGGKNSAPPPPDPNQVSSAQTQSNVNTALVNAGLNRYNTNTPLGSSDWSISGYTPGPNGTQIPNYVNNISLNPTAQSALATTQQNQLGQAQTEQGFLGNVAQQLQNPLRSSQFSPIQTSLNPSTMGDPSVNQAERTAFNSNYNLVAPLMQQQTQRMQDQMRAEGIPEGSDLWNTESQNVGREQSNQISGLAGNAVGQGIGLQSNLFGQGQAAGAFSNQAESQQMQQALALQNQPLNELNALQTGAQVQTPQFQSTPGVSMSPTNVAGNYYNSYQGAVNSANAANASSNNMFGSLLGLGGTLGGAWLMGPSS